MARVALPNLTLPKAPPITGEQWLNSPPLDAEMLRGRPVVLLFWAVSCQASWVRLRQLEALQARHGDAIAVVAVHSPRFDYECDVDVVRSAITHRGLTVPVLHDPLLETWARYGPTGRPTVIVVDTNQRVLGAMCGTDPASLEALDKIAAQQAALVDQSIEPLPDLLAPVDTTTLERLSGPAGLARLVDGRVAVIDRGHDRLVTMELACDTAYVSDVFGGLRSPGSVATRSDGTISVSFPDRGTVESIDLATKTRSVIAEGMVRPTGLTEDADGSLVVCDAGADQIVRIADDRTGPIAQAVSQPLDIVRIDNGLLFTEASTGALRLLSDDGKVHTLNNGRKPGLLDSATHKAMFQRPTGLATLDHSRVAIADHGNSRIRLMTERKVVTVPVAGLAHPEALLYLGNDELLCSDTMNDRLVLVNLASRAATALTIDGLPL